MKAAPSIPLFISLTSISGSLRGDHVTLSTQYCIDRVIGPYSVTANMVLLVEALL